MKDKPVLCPQRLRHVPRQFSWIDQRLVRDGHIRGRTPEALALYLLLCTVADARGLSYYSDASAGRLLGLDGAALRRARGELVGAGLIAYRTPFYQVLSLQPATTAGPPPPPTAGPPDPRGGEPRSAADILRSLLTLPPQ
jgi:hypothetical protein